MAHATDLNLTPKEISGLTSTDALAAFLTSLGYDTGQRKPLSPEAIGLTGDSAAAIKSIEVLSEDAEGFLRVVFVHLRSLTAKSRNDLARVLGRTNVDHLLILTSDFNILEFVLLDKRRREIRGPADSQRIQVVPLSLAIARKAVGSKELRAIRRFTWTCRDGLEQFDKLRSVFEAAAFSEDYFCNRALFADHFLLTRLREDPSWQENPSEAFQRVKSLLQDARHRWLNKGEQIVRHELFEPLFELLGFKAKINKSSSDARTQPDYLLTGLHGKTAAFVYAWDRWLDGPDFQLDHETSEENPGACVVTALEEGVADWIIMTNGRQWRLYSRHAHSRATNFYEVDLAEALIASGDTDPNEAFRYWWLFFRSEAFSPRRAPTEGWSEEGPGVRADREKGCWLDAVAEGSREYAKQLGERLKERIFVTIFPHLAQGFLEDRKRRLGIARRPNEEELHDAYEATLTLLYRLLFLLFAESRDLLPIREAPYRQASLTKIKEEIAEKAGIAETESHDRLTKAYCDKETTIYDRLLRICEAMDRGDPSLNVPIYNGGLFMTGSSKKEPKEGEKIESQDSREQRIARFLSEHKVPDRYLAAAIDRLARDPDDKTFSLVFIDYKSLEVRHLGSIYEGLLEFKLKLAEEDLTTQSEGKKEKYIPLGQAKPRRGRSPEVKVKKGEVYLSNDKAERKASGSYYTPDPIVEYIVEHTVGPVLAEKLEKLRPELRKVRKTFDNETQKAKVYPSQHDKRPPREIAADKTYLAHRNLVEDLFDFRTLDPAMGSGHFLVEAVDFITDRLLTFLNQFPVNPVTFMLDRTRQNILAALGEQGVAVDPDKLTEINLLKRHVLKRCIYGVDLNPMAVELAKVSLWLDAFTIGAPLSFLDHHLRCGNSLIGATFKDLEAVTKGQLFGIDYEPLLRAIRHVIQINQMADATAAEVKQSAGEYVTARRDLAGYQVLLDLLVARHFGYPNAPGLLEFGHDLKYSSREQLLASLSTCSITKKGEKPVTELVEEIETLASRPDLRFFHWEIEFPEVFFGFDDTEKRRLKNKNEITEGSAGFDAVVGNPPYIRVELLDKAIKAYLKIHCETISDRCDIYVGFIECGLAYLRDCGQSGFIVSNQFFNTDYGLGIRKYLDQRCAIRQLVDIAPLQIFDGALTYPAIIICSTEPQEKIHLFSMELLTSNLLENASLDTIFRTFRKFAVEASAKDLYSAEVWNVSSACTGAVQINVKNPRTARLDSICHISSTMTSGSDAVLVGRILDANNNWYEIGCKTALHPLRVSRQVWRRVIRPCDINIDGSVSNPGRVVFWPYRAISETEFELIDEEELAKMCAVSYDHVTRNRALLEQRRDSGRTWKEHGRPWYSLLRVGSPHDYDPPKLLSPGEFIQPRFGTSYDNSVIPHARVIGISCSKIPIDILRRFLHSSCALNWFRSNLPAKGGGYRGMSVGNLSKMPVPRINDPVWNELGATNENTKVDSLLDAWIKDAT